MSGGSWVKGIEAVGSALGRAPLWIAINACLALVLIFLILLPYPWTSSTNPQGNTYEEQYKADCDKADARYREFVSEPHYSGKRDDGSQYDAEKARLADELVTWCDLAAQHFAAAGATSAAKSSWWTFWTALFGVILLALTFWETRRVTSATREVGQKQVRAYISVSMSKPKMWDYVIADNTIGVSGKVIIKNVGNSPAKQVNASIAFCFAEQNSHFFQSTSIGVPKRIAPQGKFCDAKAGRFGMERKISSFALNEAVTAMVVIRYDDVFGEPFEEKFFFVLKGGNNYANWVFKNFRVVGQFRHREPPDIEWEECPDPNTRHEDFA